jgi:PKD repeat protein
LTVQFTDQSTGTIDSWAWDFENDGTVDSVEQNPSHIYSTAGAYTVNLTVTNTGGSNNDVKTDYITVGALPGAPVALFSCTPTSGTAPLTVQFTDSSTGVITERSWKYRLHSDSRWTPFIPDRSSFTFEKAGIYDIQLTVIGPDGRDAEIKDNYLRIRTSHELPVAAFSGSPTSGNAPLTVQFTDLSSNTPTSWKWEYREDSGSWTPFSTKDNPSQTFTSTGSYDIRLTVTNNEGSDSTVRRGFITVKNPVRPPVAQFSQDTHTGRAPLTIHFADHSRNNPTVYLWRFGDGATSTEKNPSHTYTQPGFYVIRLTTTNSAGSDSARGVAIVLHRWWWFWQWGRN